jgi:hypothetical protein
LRYKTNKYKKLAKLMRVEGEMLCLNTPEGMENLGLDNIRDDTVIEGVTLS